VILGYLTVMLTAFAIVREREFVRQMEYLKEKYACLTIDQAISRNGHASMPGVVVTFDDGYVNNLEVALPILERFEIPAAIYVTTQNVCERRLLWSDKIWIAVKKAGLPHIDLTGIAPPLKSYDLGGVGDQWQYRVHLLTEDVKRSDPSRREEIVTSIIRRLQELSGAAIDVDVENNSFTPLTPEQLRRLSSHPLITIGAHSHCHNLLNRIPLPQAKESILRSKEILEDITGKEIRHFSYPNGNLNDEIVDILKREGFRSAVTVPPGFFRNGDDPYRIPRMMVGAYMSLNLFKAKLTGIFEMKRKIGL